MNIVVGNKPSSEEKWFFNHPTSIIAPAIYTPFSDSIVTSFVSSGSFVGRHLIHGVQFGFGAGFAGMVTAGVANRCQHYIKKYCFSDALKDKGWKADIAQLSLRVVCHLAVGAAWGGCFAIFAPSLGVTVMTGIAIGNVTMIGYLIKCVVEKIFGFNRHRIQQKIYQQLGLQTAVYAVYFFSKINDPTNDRYIRDVVLKDIKYRLDEIDKSPNKLNMFSEIFKLYMKFPIDKEQIDAVDRLVKCIQKMEELIEKNKMKKDKFKYMLLSELTLRVTACAIANNSEVGTKKGNIQVLEEIPENTTKFTCDYTNNVNNFNLEPFAITENQRLQINEIFKGVKKVLNIN